MKVSSLPAYAICLQRRPPETDAVQSWYRVFGPRLSIANAVDCRDLDLKKDPRLHALGRMHVREPDHAGETLFALPSAGAVACALSHYALCRRAARSPKGIVVIEQDVVFDDRACEVLSELRLPPGADYVSLLYIQQHDVAPYDDGFHRLVGPRCDGNQCYYVSPRGARLALRHAFPIVSQCDLMYGVIASNLGPGRFAAFALRERLYPMWRVFRDNAFSTVQNFRIKKYLPRSNIFYYTVAGILSLLMVCFVYSL